MAFRLSIEDGRFVQTLHVDERLTVGRSVANQLRLASAGVARRHAMFRQDRDFVVVTDLAVGAGLEVNGKRTDRAELTPGDLVTIGEAKIRLVAVSGFVDPVTGHLEPGDTAQDLTAIGRAAVAGAHVTGPTEPERGSARGEGPPAYRRPSRRTAVVAHEVEFSDRLYGMTKSAPWAGISLLIHAVLLVALSFLEFDSGPHHRPIDADLGIGDTDRIAELDSDRIDQEMYEDPFEEMTRNLDDLEVREAPWVEEEIAEQGDPEELEELASLVDLRSDEIADRSIGLSASNSFGGNLSAGFDKARAGAANRTVAAILGGDPVTRVILRGLRKKSREDNVLVVRGDYDKCENIMDQLQLSHGWTSHARLARSKPDYRVRVILFNCTSARLSPSARRHLERFVRDGGFLFTTDWGIENVVEAAVPGYIEPYRVSGQMLGTKDETIGFEVDRLHPLLRGLPRKTAATRWWLEDDTRAIRVLRPDKVDVLIESEEMGRRWKSPVVAATFRHGEGRVVHVLGHFFQKEGNLRGAYAMQRLLINFLYQAVRRS